MRFFEVAVSRHRPDGYTTLWVSAKRDFSIKEMQSKLGLIGELVKAGIFPVTKLMFAYQEGVTILDATCSRFAFSKDRFIEFVLDARDVAILMNFLLNSWGGFWNIEPSNWEDVFDYNIGEMGRG